MRNSGDVTAPLESITCDKLIIAGGISSTPKKIDQDMSKFDGFYFHSVELGQRHKELVADGVNHVTVIGGHKTALETVGLWHSLTET